jgi:hypothetical protein
VFVDNGFYNDPLCEAIGQAAPSNYVNHIDETAVSKRMFSKALVYEQL